MEESLKLPYVAPQLSVFGKIEDLTRTGCLFGKTFSTSADDHWINEKFQKYGVPLSIDDCS